MKKLLVIFLLCATTWCVKGQSQDEEGVKQTLDRFSNSWSRADFSDMGEYITADCNWVNVVGMHWHNLKEIQFAHQAFVSTMFKGVKTRLIDSNIRFLTPEVAVVCRTTYMEAYFSPDGIDRGNNKQGDTNSVMTIVLLKQNGKWMITAAENVTVNKNAALSNPVLQMK